MRHRKICINLKHYLTSWWHSFPICKMELIILIVQGWIEDKAKKHLPLEPVYRIDYNNATCGWILPERQVIHLTICILSEYKSESVRHSAMSDSCGPMDGSSPGSSVHGILQARILEWVVIPFSRGSSQPRGGTQVSCIAGRFFTICATREALIPMFRNIL